MSLCAAQAQRMFSTCVDMSWCLYWPFQHARVLHHAQYELGKILSVFIRYTGSFILCYMDYSPVLGFFQIEIDEHLLVEKLNVRPRWVGFP